MTLAADDRLTYDRLVVATGSHMRRPPVPGAGAAFSVDIQAEAIALGRSYVTSRNRPSPSSAGFTGIEFAPELSDRLLAHGATRRPARFECDTIAFGR